MDLTHGEEVVHIVKEHVWVAPVTFVMAAMIMYLFIVILRQRRVKSNLLDEITELKVTLTDTREASTKKSAQVRLLKDRLGDVVAQVQIGLEYFCAEHDIKIMQQRPFDPSHVLGDLDEQLEKASTADDGAAVGAIELPDDDSAERDQ